MSHPFPLGDILSITTGCLVSRDHIDGVYRILNYMTGESLFTHQLPRAADECKPALLVQHPQLKDIEVPGFGGSKEAVYAWLTERETEFGEQLLVDPLILKQGDYSTPLNDLAQMMRPDARMHVIRLDGES